MGGCYGGAATGWSGIVSDIKCTDAYEEALDDPILHALYMYREGPILADLSRSDVSTRDIISGSSANACQGLING